MFLHKPDPELVRRLDALEARLDWFKETDQSANVARLTENLTAVIAEVSALRGDLDAVEQKLDELLTAQDSKARSIPTEEPKPEEFNAMPGHIPWSQRKAQREVNRRSSEFINRVKKSAAPTDPKPEAPK